MLRKSCVAPSVLALVMLGLGCSSDDGGAQDGQGPDAFTGGVPGVVPGSTPAAPAPGTETVQPDAPDAPGVTPVNGGGEGQPGAAPLDPTAGAPAAPGTGTSPAPPSDGTAPPAANDGTTPPGPPPPAGPTPPNFFASGPFQGLVTTATQVTGTTIAPATFDAHAAGTPFCIAGSVQRDPAFLGEATLVFTLNQAPGAEPAAIAPTANGLAVTFTRSTGSPLRLELTGPDGTWCYELPEVRGTAFAPYSEFNTTCWDGAGQPYDKQPVTSLGFEVPGRAEQETEYDFCVGGFADAADVSQAPPAPAEFLAGDIAGTLAEKFGRAIVMGADGNKYVVSNNAWSDVAQQRAQIINYVNNGFTITQQNTGNAGSQVLTFPFISIGQNGARGGNDSQTTKITDNLPIQISSIASVNTRFSHNVGQPGVQGSDFNATYDVWFAPQPPQGDYGTAAGAFLMVWTHIPAGRTPIGQVVDQGFTLEGQTWTLYVGRRDEGLASTGQDGASPVVSYVSQGTVNDYAFDLNVFIQDAVQRASMGALRGLAFPSTLFLTDVFAGFEIWGGGAGLRVNEFSADVQPR